MMSGPSAITVSLLVPSVLVTSVTKPASAAASAWLANAENSKKTPSESVLLKVLSLFFSELNM
ncbi:Uncharacterised protein [Vibrio cholerae]|nr:Uncharacterised protein [Vibrio cholerae]CSC42960.1 Uncharacterised protein [Vibrio cholerae]